MLDVTSGYSISEIVCFFRERLLAELAAKVFDSRLKTDCLVI